MSKDKQPLRDVVIVIADIDTDSRVFRYEFDGDISDLIAYLEQTPGFVEGGQLRNR